MDLLDELRAFERIASTGSLSEAGRELRIATAGISKRLGDLEARLGVRLFHRSTRGLLLTAEGAAALERTRAVLESADGLTGMFHNSPGQMTGTLRLAAPSRFGARYVVPALGDYLESHPHVDAVIHLNDRHQDLIANRLDLAVRIGDSPDSAYIVRKLAQSRRVVCAAPAFVEAHGAPAAPEDLEAYDCLVLEQKDVWRFRQAAGDERAVRVHARVHCRDSDVITDLCRRGIGIALKSQWDVFEDLAAGRLVELLTDYEVEDSARIAILLPEREFVPPRVEAFIAALRRRVGDPPVWQRQAPADRATSTTSGRGRKS